MFIGIYIWRCVETTIVFKETEAQVVSWFYALKDTNNVEDHCIILDFVKREIVYDGSINGLFEEE